MCEVVDLDKSLFVVDFCQNLYHNYIRLLYFKYRENLMDQKKIERINTLAHKEKTIGLTEEEKAEQAALRKEYIAMWRKSLENELAHTYIVTPDGKKHKVEKKKK